MEKAVFLAASSNPPAILLAVSADSRIHAGQVLKKILNESGGRGGGNAQLAQGAVISKDTLDRALHLLAAEFQ
jgi:alanyl-tRNA synthetase